MPHDKLNFDNVSVRLAKTPAEIEAAQRLRYHVFYEEYDAKPSAEMAETRLDVDEYDAHSHHLVVVDSSGDTEEIVGTYRLLLQEGADKVGCFYSSHEFDLSPLKAGGQTLLELGRSCVLPRYRARPVLNLLWQGIADYITEHKVDIMFGCASLHSTDTASLAQPLSFLYHYHLADENLRARAVDERFVDMNMVPAEQLERRAVFNQLPPLIKGYIRLGAVIGDGAVVDEQFGTTDVLIIVQTHLVTDKYRKHYERKLQKTMHGRESAES